MERQNWKTRLRSFFEDDEGKVVIGQFPNWPLVGAGLMWGLEKTGVGGFGWWGWGFRAVLFYWAYLELTEGVNGWRKLLGAGVIAWLGWSVLV